MVHNAGQWSVVSGATQVSGAKQSCAHRDEVVHNIGFTNPDRQTDRQREKIMEWMFRLMDKM